MEATNSSYQLTGFKRQKKSSRKPMRWSHSRTVSNCIPSHSHGIFTYTPTLRCSLCPAARVAKARQVGVGTVRVRVPPSSCKGVAERRGAGRRALVVGSVVGTAVLVGSAAVAVVAAARAMATSGGGREAAVLATRRGMQLFSQGDVKGSVVEFDKALELDPRQRPYLWQRGLSLYYLNRFEEGAKQFRDDVAVNPNDTEESIWCFLCEAQLHGSEEARKRFLEVGRDSRPVMRAAYELFRDGGDTKELLSLANTNAHDFFYAYLYVGLYHEAKNETEAAKDAMIAAVSSPYGSRSGDYMATLAKVHCACRGWPVKEPLNAII